MAMTDRLALAQRIVDALRDEDRLFAPASGSLPIVARVLAEHGPDIDAMNKETAESLALAGKLLMERDEQLEAAEARCVQLEQERNELRKSRLRILLDEARRRLAEYEAEHERLRAAAEMLWIVLANVSGGDWTQQSVEWQEAAARWRDSYFAALAPSEEAKS